MTSQLLLPVAVVLLASVVTSAQKPVVEETWITDGTGAPDTVGAMVRESDAVVVARYQRQARLAPGHREGDSIFSIHAFSIVEVLKFVRVIGAVGDTLEVGLLGGVAEYRDRIVRHTTEGVSPLVADRTYLLFLRWVPRRAAGELVPAWAFGGVYDISLGRVQALDQRGRRYQDRSAESFLGEVRKAR